MDNRYLWDRSGPVDPEIERLERLLGTFRQSRRAPELPRRPHGNRWTAFLAAAAALALLVSIVWLARSPAKASWEVARLDGRPAVGSQPIGETGELPVGEWLETDGSSRARLRVGRIGEVEVEPNSRLRLLKARWIEHRIALSRGSIEARIWAPPRLFFVETPSALAVDLGCVYSLTVDETGAGQLSVTAGWVQFERDGRESLVPAGAACETKPGIGPGTPYYEDSSPALRQALREFDFQSRESALEIVLAEARKRDGLTLWHLLMRASGQARARVYDRLAWLIPPPTGMRKEGVLRLEDRMLKLWRDELELPWFQKEVPWWRRAWHRIWS